nr:HepT-like ribonuclease domain-containing protein [Clostridium grantii]
MVRFRNIAVHNYKAINTNILEEIIEKHLDNLKEFTFIILKKI